MKNEPLGDYCIIEPIVPVHFLRLQYLAFPLSTFDLRLSPMNHLWSPWRMEYIENHNKPDGCVFCLAQASEDSADNLIAHRGGRAYVILNRYPYTSGHLMVVPFEHRAVLEELDPQTRAEMMDLT